MIKLLQKRFDELATQLKGVEATRHTKHSESWGSYEQVDSELFLNWCVKARSLLSRACGEESQHFSQFEKCEEPSMYSGNYEQLKRVKAVFLAAKEDFEGGYLTSVRSLVQAEVFDSELEQATELLAAGYRSAAAVVAGIVLETTLRDLCDAKGIPRGKLDKMNAELAKIGVYNKLVQKRITALADIRNSAAHGNVDEFSSDDVESMIAEVKRFVSNSFSS